MAIARIDNDAIAELRELALDDVPAHKRAMWRGIEGDQPAFVASLETCTGPSYTIEPTRVLRTWLPGYARLSQSRRETVLRGWRDSSVPLMRTGFQALRKAALAFAYMLPGRWAELGYPGPPGVWGDAPAPRLVDRGRCGRVGRRRVLRDAGPHDREHRLKKP